MAQLYEHFLLIRFLTRTKPSCSDDRQPICYLLRNFQPNRRNFLAAHRRRRRPNQEGRGSTRGGILRHYNQKSLHAGKIIPERRRIIYILLGMRFSTELMQLSQMSKLPRKMNFRSLYKYKSLYSLKYALASQLVAIKKKGAM